MPTALALFERLGGSAPGARCSRASSATDAALDATLHWIPKGMQVNYLKAARGTLTATASMPPIGDVGTGHDCPVSVDVRNAADESVFSASISMWITRRHR